jgi:hypothetical protein
MMRKAGFAGQFYPENAKELEKAVKSLMKGLKSAAKRKVYGIISPHAGYVYSGKAAASAYNQISGKEYDTFIILGVNHTGYGGKISVSDEDFEIPSGIIKADREFCSELIKKFGRNDEAHKFEHSIEVQLPFLMHSSKNPRIVPIILSLESYEECKELAEELEKAIRKLKRNACIIASSDFTHYGYGYGFLPFTGNTEEVKKKLHELDKNAIKLIEKLKAKEFFEHSGNMTICGAAAITVSLELCKRLGAKKASLLKYYTSGDVSGDYNNSVGYASIVFTD